MDPWNGRRHTVVYSTPLPCLPSFSSWCLGEPWTPMTSYHCGMSFLKHSRKTCRAGDLFPFQPHAGICQSAVTCLECFPVFWQITRFAALIPLGLADFVSCLKADFFFFFSGSWSTFLVWSLAMHCCWSLRSHKCSVGWAPSGACDFGKCLKEVDLLGACLGWICASPERLTSFQPWY